jgi:hypothetical protein
MLAKGQIFPLCPLDFSITGFELSLTTRYFAAFGLQNSLVYSICIPIILSSDVILLFYSQ